MEICPPILYDGGLCAALPWLGRWMEQNQGLRVDVRLDEESEPEGEAVRVLLFEGARELLFNVVKHASAKRAELTLEMLVGRRVRLTVSDDGKGFDPATLHRQPDEATGMGLFSLGGRLELLGAELQIVSQPGHGTEVSMIAPLSSERAQVIESAEAQAATMGEYQPVAPRKTKRRARRTRVLIADDHPTLRKGLCDLLSEENDIEVVGMAIDGQMAVEMAQQIEPDVVVMDLTMPDMNGIEATRQITANRPATRVIALSIHEEADMATAVMKAGASAYFTKYGPPEELIAMIRAQAKMAPPRQQAQA